MFFAFEGIDGSGKSTQAKLLYESLKQKNKVLLTEEPTNGIIGKSIKELLKRSDLSPMAMQMLFAADREEHVSKLIIPKLNDGYHIITDRYFLSTIAYGMASGVDEKRLEGLAYGLPNPALTFVLDIDVDIAYGRLEKTRDALSIYEHREFLEKVREAYLGLAKKRDGCIIIDASRKTNEVSEDILQAIGKKSL